MKSYCIHRTRFVLYNLFVALARLAYSWSFLRSFYRPFLLYLLRQSALFPITPPRLVKPFKPNFSEQGTNRRSKEEKSCIQKLLEVCQRGDGHIGLVICFTRWSLIVLYSTLPRDTLPGDVTKKCSFYLHRANPKKYLTSGEVPKNHIEL
jgi:hypothetical protein